jgi:hypothetical protein
VALLLQPACVSKGPASRSAVPAESFAIFATLDQVTPQGRLSCAVAVTALVALQLQRETAQWPATIDPVMQQARGAGAEPWLLEALGELMCAPVPDGRLLIARKDGSVLLAQVDRAGAVDVPVGSELRRNEGGGGRAGSLTGTILSEFISQLLRAL